MTALRKLRLHLEERDGTLRNAAQVTFTGRDASLYLISYATHGEYFYGVTEMPAGHVEGLVNLACSYAVQSGPAKRDLGRCGAAGAAHRHRLFRLAQRGTHERADN